VTEPDRLAGLGRRDWRLDGRKIRGRALRAIWRDLDWSRARLDLGPSPAGNPGPYWHVPRRNGETTHRLSPRFDAKWLPVVRRAIEEAAAWPPEQLARLKELEEA
jgi:hypothetical protein